MRQAAAVLLGLLGWAVFSIGELLAEEGLVAEQDALYSEEELAELEKAASEVRELGFQKEVDYEVVDKSSLRGVIDERVKEEFPADKLERISLAYAKLGLIEKGVSLREAMLSLYSEQIAAFYDQKKRKLYSIKGLPFSKEFQKVLMVHELTHALQDQNFDLTTLPLELEDNDDRAMAALSLVEGDATLVFTQYATREVRLSLKDILAVVTTGQKGLTEAPYALQKNLMFPYLEGVRFVTRLHTEGGWEAVNKAFKNLPESTEQIMHPDKYLKERDDPVAIVLPEFGSVGGKEWELQEDNVLGELNIKVLFTQFIGSLRATRPSRGWGGDRFRVYRVKGDNDTILIWGTAWDTEKDREEFVTRYLQGVRKKYGKKEFRTIEEKDSATLVSDEVVIWLGWRGKEALVLEAPDGTTLAGMLWKFVRGGSGLGIVEEAPAASARDE
ncbi:MAG: hypothetical protein Q8Q12_20830 [bacterium]|nr:hypothetical protein [bacterium]